jgi:hypothetical protein
MTREAKCSRSGARSDEFMGGLTSFLFDLRGATLGIGQFFFQSWLYVCLGCD